MVKYALILNIHMHNITIFVTRHLSSGLTNLLKHLLKGLSLIDLLAVESEVKHSVVKSKTKLDDQLNYTQVVTLLLPSWVRKLHFPTVLPALCLLLLT